MTIKGHALCTAVERSRMTDDERRKQGSKRFNSIAKTIHFAHLGTVFCLSMGIGVWLVQGVPCVWAVSVHHGAVRGVRLHPLLSGHLPHLHGLRLCQCRR